MLAKSISKVRLPLVLTFVKGYQAYPKYNTKNYYQHSNGYLTEAQWGEKRNIVLSSLRNGSDNKIIDQPVKIDCNNVQFKTWNKFSEIENIDSRLVEVLQKNGQDVMTPIQKNTFDIINRQLIDLLGSAETGSGKTIAFLSPILSNILKHYPRDMMNELQQSNGSVQYPLFLVLAPTRELVQQIALEGKKLLRLTSLRVVDIIGGVKPYSQISNLSTGCHSLIATPGRLIDFVSRGIISLKYCNQIVIDEADRMLDMGFEPQIRQIIEQFDLPKENSRHTSMFSATFPKDVVELAQTLMKSNFGQIMIGPNAGSNETCIPESINQNFVVSSLGSMIRDVFDFLKNCNKKTIVFCNRKSDVDMLQRFARNQNIKLAALHGDFSQLQRTREFHLFKSNEVQVLAATSIAARGIDVSDVQCVVNLGLPTSVDDYMHRVGRCGRMGRVGESMTFVLDSDLHGSVLRDLVRMLRRTQIPIPDFMEQAVNTGSSKVTQPFRPRHNYPPRNAFSNANRYRFQNSSQGFASRAFSNQKFDKSEL